MATRAMLISCVRCCCLVKQLRVSPPARLTADGSDHSVYQLVIAITVRRVELMDRVRECYLLHLPVRMILASMASVY